MQYYSLQLIIEINYSKSLIELHYSFKVGRKDSGTFYHKKRKIA